MTAKLKTINYIQSCLVSVSFPENLKGVLNMLKGNNKIAKWSNDLDLLLNFQNGDSVFWTAPKWLTENDIIFFYHTKQAKIRSSRLLAEALEKFPRRRSLIGSLRRAKEKADLYSGSIFACASVAGTTELLDKQNKHFISRLFAPLKEVHVFEKPLQQENYAEYLRIGRNTIMPLFKKEFDGIKKLLSEDDTPDFLLHTSLGNKTFKNINIKNWRLISCLPDTRFIHESQLRAYLTDFFLNELRDKGTPILEECDCFRGVCKTGRADYFIKINDKWLPVEVKLNISKDNHLLEQTAKYMNISSFSPSKGLHRNFKFELEFSSLCLIFDKDGIYFSSQNGEFIKSGFRKPFLKREDFTKEAICEVREVITNLLK